MAQMGRWKKERGREIEIKMWVGMERLKSEGDREREVQESEKWKFLQSQKLSLSVSFRLPPPLASRWWHLPCYEGEWGRPQQSVYMFSWDGCLSRWVIRSRWEQASWLLLLNATGMTTAHRWETERALGGFPHLKQAWTGLTSLRHAAWRMRPREKPFHPRVTVASELPPAKQVDIIITLISNDNMLRIKRATTHDLMFPTGTNKTPESWL